MPINLGTINSFYNINLKPFELEQFISGKREHFATPRNLEEMAVSLVGRDLYGAFIKGYTIKQWDCEPKDLPADIITRLPVRRSYYDSYYSDIYQGLPLKGYTDLFRNMLNKVPVEISIDFFADREYWRKRCKFLIYTGPIDRYFDYAQGELTWRSVRFESELVNVDDYQGTSVMNYADLDVPYTRIHEPKHLHPEKNYQSKSTVVIKEYSAKCPDEPYYPVNFVKDREICHKYMNKAAKEKGVFFGGRLAEYKYYDMHAVIEKALIDVRGLITA